jgi:hypothetical protein
VGGGLAVAQQGPPDKITLCHNLEDTGEVDLVQSRNSNRGLFFVNASVYEGTEIEVSERAKDAHLAHWDVEGECNGTATVDGDIVALEERTGR